MKEANHLLWLAAAAAVLSSDQRRQPQLSHNPIAGVSCPHGECRYICHVRYGETRAVPIAFAELSDWPLVNILCYYIHKPTKVEAHSNGWFSILCLTESGKPHPKTDHNLQYFYVWGKDEGWSEEGLRDRKSGRKQWETPYLLFETYYCMACACVSLVHL